MKFRGSEYRTVGEGGAIEIRERVKSSFKEPCLATKLCFVYMDGAYKSRMREVCPTHVAALQLEVDKNRLA